MRAQSMKMKRRELTAQSSDSAEVIEKLKDHERGRIKRDEEDSGSIMTVHTGIKGHKHLTSSDCRSVGGSLYTQVTPSFMFQRTHTHTPPQPSIHPDSQCELTTPTPTTELHKTQYHLKWSYSKHCCRKYSFLIGWMLPVIHTSLLDERVTMIFYLRTTITNLTRISLTFFNFLKKHHTDIFNSLLSRFLWLTARSPLLCFVQPSCKNNCDWIYLE